MNKDLLNQLQQDLFAVHNQLNNRKFLVKSKDGEYVEIKQYSNADLGVDGKFYVHKPLKGDGYVVSEASTGLKIADGINEGIAIGKARSAVNSFVEKNGIEAFKAMLAKHVHAPISEPVKEVEPEPIAEPVIVPIEEKPNTIETALGKSLDYHNRIDIPYISEQLMMDEMEVEEMLLSKGLAFINPESEEMETVEEYLSGNVREKLVVAEFASKQSPKYERNYEELKKVIPETIPSALIQYSLGAAWIPLKIFEKFATDMFKTKITVVYMKSTGKFSATNRSMRTIQMTSTYSAGGKNGLEIFNATLNNQQIVVTDIIDKKSVKNIEKTTSAQAMQEQMQDEFVAFIRANPDIETETEEIYNNLMNSHVQREYRDATIDIYPGASNYKILRRHQKRAVQRAMKESTLFAHDVGSGKTISIITTAMELRRLGLANKVMIVVQNKTRGQFIEEFRLLYPNAIILAPTAEDFQGFRKADFYDRIANEDFDAVILPQSQFDLIPDDLERQKDVLNAQVELAETIVNNISRHSAPFEYAQAKRAVRMAQNELSKLYEEEDKRLYAESELKLQEGYKPLLNFEQMNVDALLLDEFTRYKRLGFATSLSQIRGIDSSKSRRSQSCFLKMRWVQQNNNGRNTHTYTGTPISNTMAEVWTQMRYVRPDVLMEMGIEHFDQFAKTFGQIVPSLEMTGGGTFKIANRFAKFQNLPELVGAFKKCADVVQKEDIIEFIDTKSIPKLFNGRIDQVVVKRSDELKEQIKEFRELLEWYDALEGAQKRQYNYIPLVTFNRAKQAAIDLRLLNPTKMDSSQSKINQCIRRAYAIYKETGLVQMIFCDLYQSPEPKSPWLDDDETIPNPAFGKPRFNLFNDIKTKLVSMGIKPQEIAILTEPKYDKIEKATQLFDDANKGRVKFLLGTTEKMGVGVNAQQKLFALHHVDAPQRPMDFAQRNGRIERQGNTNEFIWLITYGTEKTLDSAAFQRLAIKQKFINQIMKGENLERVMDDAADDALVTFEEMMAILSDSPFAQQKLLLDNKLKTERLKRDNHHAKQVQTQRQLNNAYEAIRSLELKLESEKEHFTTASNFFPDGALNKLDIKGVLHNEHLATALDEYIEELMAVWNDSPAQTAIGRIKANGADVTLKIVNTERWSKHTKGMYDHPTLTYVIPQIGINENYYGNGVTVDSNSGSGMLMSMRWKVEGALEAPVRTQREMDTIATAITELEKNMDNVFDETKLFELEAEIEVLKQKMLEERLKPEVEQEILEVN